MTGPSFIYGYRPRVAGGDGLGDTVSMPSFRSTVLLH
jgi:hypothetical protein